MLRYLGIEVWRHGALKARCRRVDAKVCSPGTLKARCRRTDVEAWSSGVSEL